MKVVLHPFFNIRAVEACFHFDSQFVSGLNASDGRDFLEVFMLCGANKKWERCAVARIKHRLRKPPRVSSYNGYEQCD